MALSLYHQPLPVALLSTARLMRFVDVAGPALAAIAAAASALLALWLIVRNGKGIASATLCLIAGVFALTVVTLGAIHGLFGISYPLGRGALYLVPLATLATLGAAAQIAWKPVKVAALATAAALAAHYLAETNVRVYAEWAGEAGSKAAVQALVREAGNRPIRIAASATLEPALSFYRERYRLRQWPTIQAKPAADGFDYYVVCGADSALIQQKHLRTVFDDGAILVSRAD
jgi:hypothetical protein